MSSDLHGRATKVFLEAVEQQPDDLVPFLDKACSGDPELRSYVESLLACDRSDARDLQTGKGIEAAGRVLASQTSGPHPIPVRIGPYHNLRRLGEGAMGIVCLADERGPVHRQVALKIIKAGAITGDVAARIEMERQTLAMMKHPFIATIHGAGVDDAARPYISMEYIEGTPITQYCDDQRLTIRKRLNLFTQVCEGVQHAHQKAVIHRDLKPSNVLVTTIDGKPIPKIIDFGIAKIIAPHPGDGIARTLHGVPLGTLEYMSPEQTGLPGAVVDTRADVYSLGAILYELLTGALPLDPESFRDTSIDRSLELIREVDPPRPSVRLGGPGEDADRAASLRSTNRVALARLLRDDLDWIVMRCLEKDPDRRYDSPGDLAADVARYLNGEAVTARPPSQLYKARKFARRHKFGVAFATSLFLILAVTAAVMSILAARIANERARANQEAAAANEVADFLVRLFRVSDVRLSKGERLEPRQLLDDGRQRIQDEFGDQPALQARLMETMGQAYLSLGKYEPARELFEPSLDLRIQLYGPDSLEVSSSLVSLGNLHNRLSEPSQALPLFERALAIRKRLLESNDLSLAGIYSDIGDCHWYLNDIPVATSNYQRALSIRRKTLGERHQAVAKNVMDLADIALHVGNYEEAISLYGQAESVFEEKLGCDHPYLANLYNNLAVALIEIQQFDPAWLYIERSLAMSRVRLGEAHPDLAGPLNNFGLVLSRRGDLRGAGEIFQEALQVTKAAHNTGHPDEALSLDNLGSLSILTQDFQQAERYLTDALEIWRVNFGEDDTDFAMTLSHLGVLHLHKRDYEAAEEAFSRALTIREKYHGTDSPQVAETLEALSELYRKKGDSITAGGYAKRALDIRKQYLAIGALAATMAPGPCPEIEDQR